MIRYDRSSLPIQIYRFGALGAAACLYAALAVGTVSAQQKLPEGPGKATMIRVCSPCHSAENVFGRGKSREEWGEIVGDMVMRGAQGSDEDFYDIVDYLTEHFPKSAATNKVYVNTAGPKEFERELQLSPKEAEALVRYRSQHGSFKTFEDLRKVAELDVKKLEAKKERLVF
jgi:competence protein ComEA